jgi:hypothetical protein
MFMRESIQSANIRYQSTLSHLSKEENRSGNRSKYRKCERACKSTFLVKCPLHQLQIIMMEIGWMKSSELSLAWVIWTFRYWNELFTVPSILWKYYGPNVAWLYVLKVSKIYNIKVSDNLFTKPTFRMFCLEKNFVFCIIFLYSGYKRTKCFTVAVSKSHKICWKFLAQFVQREQPFGHQYDY